MKKINSIKSISFITCLVMVLIGACKKDNGPFYEIPGHFQIYNEKSSLKGNLVGGIALSANNVFNLVFVNPPKNSSAKISAEAVNGISIDETTVNLTGTSIDIPLKGTPTTDGSFDFLVKVTVDGTTYVCNTKFYVDMPNITSITFPLPETQISNVNVITNTDFEIYPKSTDFEITAPAGLTVEIINVSATTRRLVFTPTATFVGGNVVITAKFMNLPSTTKTIFATAFKDGNGTTALPFGIEDADRLNRMRFGLNNAYKLLNDIAQNNTFSIDGIFNGVLDGDGKKISNVTINKPSIDNVGYFAETGSAAVIKNITFENLAVTGQNNVGALVGTNKGTITATVVKGNVAGKNYVSGVAAINFGSISNCNVTGVNVTGDNNVASLAAKVNSGSSETGNTIIVVPTGFPASVYSISSVKVVDFAFAPADGTLAVKTAPTGLTAVVVSGKQQVTLTPAGGFISGDLQLELKKNTLTALRTIKIYSKAEGSVFDGGDGSVANPYLISNAEGLDNIRLQADKNYKIINDITLSTAWTPVPGVFSGSLDGGGYKVNGLKITSTTANEGFVSTLKGSIKNIQFLGVDCNTSAAFGVVAGLTDGGTIQNLKITGNVNSTNTADILGGVSGELYNGGKVTQCIADLKITATCGMIGGLVGRLRASTSTPSEISLSTMAGTIDVSTAKSRIAGILGRGEGTANVISGTIKNCVSSVAITSPVGISANGVGGIFGADQAAGIVPIDQCIFNGTISSGYFVGGIAGVGSSITNCLVQGNGSAQTTPTLRATGTPPAGNGNLGGITGGNKIKMINCIVKNTTLKSAISTAAFPIAGLSSIYQNDGYTANCFIANTSIEGSNTAPNTDFVYRIAGTAANGTGANAKNYAAANVTAPLRTSAFVNDATGLDGANATAVDQNFFSTTLGFDFTNIWKMDTDGYPTLKNAGYNGNLK